jgi:hypothetical protein
MGGFFDANVNGVNGGFDTGMAYDYTIPGKPLWQSFGLLDIKIFESFLAGAEASIGAVELMYL